MLTDTDGEQFELGIADSFTPVLAEPGAGGGWDVWVIVAPFEKVAFVAWRLSPGD
jgi:hypothetical protein